MEIFLLVLALILVYQIIFDVPGRFFRALRDSDRLYDPPPQLYVDKRTNEWVSKPGSQRNARIRNFLTLFKNSRK